MILPELRLSPRYPINEHIRRLPQRQRNWASSLIPGVPILVVPLLSVTKEECLAMSSHREVGPAQSPRCRALRIRDRDAVSEPVLDVVVPGELSLDRDVAILQIEHIHDFRNGEVAFGDFDLAVLPALLEGVHDG